MRNRRHNQKGRSKKEGRFVPLPLDTLNHPAWRSLSGNAIKLFLELRSRFNGGNNGSLRLSFDEAARLLGMSKGTVSRAYGELEKSGFIRKTKEGQWYGRKATEWATTDLPCDGYPASKDWRTQNAKDRPKTDPRYCSGPYERADGSKQVPKI